MLKNFHLVSIPYLSGHPFLQEGILSKFKRFGSCQSPIYRDTHFYGYESMVRIVGAECQSPIYRDTHFYKIEAAEAAQETNTVSIPYLSGHPFLPIRITMCPCCEEACVNPLSIGTPISTIRYTTDMSRTSIVSIPYLSGHPFLRNVCGVFKRDGSCVNPLSIGTPISTSPASGLMGI